MNPKFTLAERVCSGFYFGIVAALSLSIIFADIRLLTPIFLGGLCSGFFIPAAILNPTEYKTLRAIGAGSLTTLCAALITGLLMGVFYESGLKLTNFSNYSYAKLVEQVKMTFFFMGFGAIFAIPYSLIGSIAAIALSHVLTNRRKKYAPEIEPSVFE
ncbi:hypothetical protein WH95_01790 [Kiloniella litopenaei]|uniref:Uncharacterized protein n=1 Tax=Kiloniella litopenaei TaxID=1549748 RepID=A0A0M2RDM7_9PROT|nr:hypothetical protein [Kiloniella litopenaei]KKJ78110.1 hypothetical protein WH95_01790 [Kiloniella litopenaei]